MTKKRIGILTSGGDCPGLNAVIRGVVRAADKLDWEVVGFIDGFEGLLQPGDYRILDRHSTALIMPQGGTILGTTNKGHFISKIGAGDKVGVAPETVENAREILTRLRVDGLILVGGDGSLTTGLQLFEAGFPIIGVPKTIDNDLEATAMTFGFDSAVACVADALDRLQTTGISHKRVMVLEVMGRHAGWIALYGGLAGGANVILIPEIPFTYDRSWPTTSTGATRTATTAASWSWPKEPSRSTASRSCGPRRWKANTGSAASASRCPTRSPSAPARKRAPACSATSSAAARRRRSTASWEPALGSWRCS